jgi:hypothetical protein
MPHCMTSLPGQWMMSKKKPAMTGAGKFTLSQGGLENLKPTNTWLTTTKTSQQEFTEATGSCSPCRLLSFPPANGHAACCPCPSPSSRPSHVHLRRLILQSAVTHGFTPSGAGRAPLPGRPWSTSPRRSLHKPFQLRKSPRSPFVFRGSLGPLPTAPRRAAARPVSLGHSRIPAHRGPGKGQRVQDTGIPARRGYLVVVQPRL